jgi:uroporphyrinogen III methyltransferase/synthase
MWVGSIRGSIFTINEEVLRMDAGKVLFVGAGPGDPDLITVRGVKALQQADIIVYDRLAAPQLLKYAKPEAELVYCGKEPGLHSLAQDEITQLLVREALRGRVVARLKGGDPGIFGRVWEEAEACVERGVPFEVIPGVTAGIAASAYAGIPLTHREYSSNVTFVSGHRSPTSAADDTDWRAVAGCDTVVVYMGVGNLPDICANLRGIGGKSPDTPAALVRWGTTSEQATLTGSLTTIAAQAKKAGYGSPAILVVGEAVKLREKLGWYERQPLFGRKVLILGSRGAVEEEAGRWSALGAETAEIAVDAGDAAGAAAAAAANLHGPADQPYVATGIVAHASGYVDELLLRGGFDTLLVCGSLGLDALRIVAARPDRATLLRTIPALLGSDAFIEAEAQALLGKPLLMDAVST